MQDQPAVGLYLDTRRPVKDGKFPVKVRVTFEVYVAGKSKYISKYFHTKAYITPQQFETITRGTARGELRLTQEKIYKDRAKAAAIIERNKKIKMEQFILVYEDKVSVDGNVKDMFTEIIAEKKLRGKPGTAITYENALESISKYQVHLKRKIEDLYIVEIDQNWLSGYEQWMLSLSNSIATIGIYLRNLKAVFNIAIARKIVPAHIYPFGKEKYMIRKKRTIKQVPSAEVKNTLASYVPDTEKQKEALDFALFSYYCNGMNFTDMAFLREENFASTYFKFIRRKTMDTVKEQVEIKIPITPRIREILNRRAIHKPYVFGIITDEMDAEEKKYQILLWIQRTNKLLKKIAKKIGYSGKTSTYLFRHLFTKMLVEGGVPLTKVSDALGHNSVTTTEIYTEDLDLNTSSKFDSML